MYVCERAPQMCVFNKNTIFMALKWSNTRSLFSFHGFKFWDWRLSRVWVNKVSWVNGIPLHSTVLGPGGLENGLPSWAEVRKVGKYRN